MSLVDRSGQAAQWAGRQLPCAMRRRQNFKQLLPELARVLSHPRGPRSRTLSQMLGQRGSNDASQFGKSHQFCIARQTLDWLRQRPLVERVDEIKRRVASAPVEGIIGGRHDELVSQPFE